MMRILVACEESQRVCAAFRERGHESFSCDIVECSGGHPEWHILGDVIPILNGRCEFTLQSRQTDRQTDRWDLIIAFPPCTYMTNAGAVRMRVNGEIQQDRLEKALQAKEFFMKIWNSDCDRIAIENPVPMKIVGLPISSQVLQPYWFGHPYSKKTYLWLKGLPPLMSTDILSHHEPFVNGGCKDAHGNPRKHQGGTERDGLRRSKTFEGIAKAMAAQWG